MPASTPSDRLKVPSASRQRRPSITLSAPVDEHRLRPRSPNSTDKRSSKGHKHRHPAEGLRPLQRDSRSSSRSSSRQSSRAGSPSGTAANAIPLDSRDYERDIRGRKRRSRSNSVQPPDRDERQAKRRHAIHTDAPTPPPDRPRSASVQLIASSNTAAQAERPQSNPKCLLDRLSPRPCSPATDHDPEDTSMAEPEARASDSASGVIETESSPDEAVQEIRTILGAAINPKSQLQHHQLPHQPQSQSLTSSQPSHHKSNLPRSRSRSEADWCSSESRSVDRFYGRPGVHQLLDRRGRHIDLAARDPRPLPMDGYLFDFFEDLNPGLGRTEPALRLVHYGFTPSRLEGVTADMWSWYIDFVFGATFDYSVFILKSTIIEAYLN